MYWRFRNYNDKATKDVEKLKNMVVRSRMVRTTFKDFNVAPYLSMQNIIKSYSSSGVIANDGVDFQVEKGEIHALVGENGAGKTTLMKILYGIEVPDSGDIFIGNKKSVITTPLAANRLGIGMVHQHFKLIKEFTVAQNVVLGTEPRKGGIIYDNRKAIAEVEKVIEDNNFHISPDKRISELSVGQMQQVEIVKMLYRKAELLILDEPTSVLTEQEIKWLFITLKRLVSQDKTIIIITHKLAEVKDISDRITVMRRGKVITVKNTADVDEMEISRLMVGKSISFEFERETGNSNEDIFRMDNVSIKKSRQARPLLDHISFSAPTCEIVGITGVAGNGLTELEDVIAGLRPVTSGCIFHNDEDITHLSAGALRKRGLAYVPTDRLKRGSSLETSVKENMIITNHHNFIQAGGIFNREEIEIHTNKLLKEYQIDGAVQSPIGTLSGGNIQKVILARELALVQDLILFSEPTWGLDVASSEFIYEKMLEMRARGVAVILISSNLDEILALADVVMVMYRGKIVTKKKNTGLDREGLGEYMLGLKDDFSTDEIREGVE